MKDVVDLFTKAELILLPLRVLILLEVHRTSLGLEQKGPLAFHQLLLFLWFEDKFTVELRKGCLATVTEGADPVAIGLRDCWSVVVYCISCLRIQVFQVSVFGVRS